MAEGVLVEDVEGVGSALRIPCRCIRFRRERSADRITAESVSFSSSAELLDSECRVAFLEPSTIPGGGVGRGGWWMAWWPVDELYLLDLELELISLILFIPSTRASIVSTATTAGYWYRDAGANSESTGVARGDSS